MKNFVLAGKAHTVFDSIALMAKREAELNLAMRNLSYEVKKQGEFICPKDKVTRCTKPTSQSCESIDCPILRGEK